jgi:type II secretory pathway component GspD/PulD (secretin)
MNNILIYSVVLFAAALICAPSANALDLRLTGDKLSVHADKEPLQGILQRLSDLWGIKIRIDPHINPIVTCSFEDRDIRQALDSILKPFGHVLIWETLEGSAGHISKLVEIQVFKPGKRDLMKPLGEKFGTTVPDKLRGSSPFR